MQGRVFLAALSALVWTHGASALFINELHYDNAGSDVGEGIELAGAAGTALDGHTLLLYNGGNGQVYRSISLAGTLTDQAGGYGTLFFEIASMQNGGPDGIALVDDQDTVLQFLSYEGTFTATEGAASGLLSTDIGISQDGSGAAGESLQLVGTGLSYADFTWTSAVASYGSINAQQTFAVAPVPLPAGVWLLLCAASTLAAVRRS